jgi:hypothetical protein
VKARWLLSNAKGADYVTLRAEVRSAAQGKEYRVSIDIPWYEWPRPPLASFLYDYTPGDTAARLTTVLRSEDGFLRALGVTAERKPASGLRGWLRSSDHEAVDFVHDEFYDPYRGADVRLPPDTYPPYALLVLAPLALGRSSDMTLRIWTRLFPALLVRAEIVGRERVSVPAGDFDCVHLHAEPQFFETFRDPDRPHDSVARLAAAFASDSAGNPHAEVWVQADPPHAMVRAVGNLAASLRGMTQTLALVEYSVHTPSTVAIRGQANAVDP